APGAVDEGAREPGVVRGGDGLGERLPPALVSQTRGGFLAVQGKWLHGCGLFGIVLSRHLVFAERNRYKLAAGDPHAVAHGALTNARKVGGELVEVFSLPYIARMIVALGTLDLDAQEDPGSLGRQFGLGISALA